MPPALARALAEAVGLVGELAAAGAAEVAVPPGALSATPQPAPVPRTPPPAPSPAAMARLASSITHILASLEQLSVPAEVGVSTPRPRVADGATPQAGPPGQAQPLPTATPRVNAPAPAPETAPASTPAAPPAPLGQALAEIKSQLQGILAVAVFEAAPKTEAAVLDKSLVLARLAQGAAALPLLTAQPGTPPPLLQVFDPYRMGLIAALHYREVVRRRRDPERCYICLRLMIRTLTGELRCPRCY
jgi:hypothetical protein